MTVGFFELEPGKRYRIVGANVSPEENVGKIVTLSVQEVPPPRPDELVVVCSETGDLIDESYCLDYELRFEEVPL